MAILLMILIFYFSQQPVTISNNLSTRITERIIQTIGIIVPIGDVPVEKLNHIVRKNAHFFLYFSLGIFVLTALKKSGIKGYHNLYIAFFLCIIYTISDEVHQLFVTGRGAQVKDVLIDSTGAATGIMVATIIGLFISRTNGTTKPSKKIS